MSALALVAVLAFGAGWLAGVVSAGWVVRDALLRSDMRWSGSQIVYRHTDPYGGGQP